MTGEKEQSEYEVSFLGFSHITVEVEENDDNPIEESERAIEKAKEKLDRGNFEISEVTPHPL